MMASQVIVLLAVQNLKPFVQRALGIPVEIEGTGPVEHSIASTDRVYRWFWQQGVYRAPAIGIALTALGVTKAVHRFRRFQLLRVLKLRPLTLEESFRAFDLLNLEELNAAMSANQFHRFDEKIAILSSAAVELKNVLNSILLIGEPPRKDQLM